MANTVGVFSYEYDNQWVIMLANFTERLKMCRMVALPIYLLAASLTRHRGDRGHNYSSANQQTISPKKRKWMTKADCIPNQVLQIQETIKAWIFTMGTWTIECFYQYCPVMW